MKRVSIAFLMVALSVASIAQSAKIKQEHAGAFSLGVRTAVGLVNDGRWQQPAFGTGGQFGIRFGDRVDSEWIFDYLTADLNKLGFLTDYHIGWSLMYLLTKKPDARIQPFVLAGHCFEYLKYTGNDRPKNSDSRYSASVQAGLGTHINLSSKFFVSLETQYMLHFGTKIQYSSPEGVAVFEKQKGLGIADHLLFHLSLNYKIADLW